MNTLLYRRTKRYFKLLSIGLVSCAFMSTYSLAQDVHFSQVTSSPLNLNPAMVGIDNAVTASVNYRMQWKAIAKPYSTIAASADFRLNEKAQHQKKGIMAMGVNFYNDQAGDVKISTTVAQVHFGYHLIINNNNTIGAALYGGFGNRYINTDAGRWGNQFSGLGYDPNLPSNEFFVTDKFSYFDVGAGFLWRYRSNESFLTRNDSRQFTVGVAAYHLSRPNYSFLNKNDDRLYMRITAFANAIIGFDNTNISLMPGIYFQNQGPAYELLLGTYLRYRLQTLSSITGFNKAIFLSFGLFYRNMDAVSPQIMCEYNDFTLGFAYDANISALNVVSKGRGGFEIFLKYGLTRGYAGNRSKI